MDHQNNTEEENIFIHIYFETSKRQVVKAIFPFFIFILYVSIRLIFRGNAEVYYLSYKEIIYFSIASFLTISIYTLANINNLEKKINLRKLWVAGLEGISQLFSYFAWLFYIYCIIFIGVLSLLDFKYGFSIFPIIKLFVFGGIGVYGIIELSHLLKIGKMLSDRKEPYEIISYIFKHKLYERPDNIAPK